MEKLPIKSFDTLLPILKDRFIKNERRHLGVRFDDIEAKMKSSPTIQDALLWMENTGGEPDVALIEEHLYFIDFAKETPQGRLNTCFDLEARMGRKKFPPVSSALEMIEGYKVSLLSEEMYKDVQALEDLDLKTSSWLATPKSIRDLGGALFGDKRYGRPFIYHNGADSYYSVRGFRVYLSI